jgi:hypothetical protein
MPELPNPAGQAATPQAAVAAIAEIARDAAPRRLGLGPTRTTRIILAHAILVLAALECALAVAGRTEARAGTSDGSLAVPFLIVLLVIVVLAGGLLPRVWLKESTLCRIRINGGFSRFVRWDLSEVYVGLDGSTLSFVDVGTGHQMTAKVSRNRKKLLALAAMLETWGAEDLGAVRAAAGLRALAAPQLPGQGSRIRGA